jgi:predicted extracellular nuclease
VDDSAYDYVGYVANDPDEQISLIFYWYDGVIYWSFMSFYHEDKQEDLLLEDGETVVLYNSAQTAFSAAELESKSEWYANNDICNFNGNDQIALSNNGVVIDMVGVLGNSSDFAKDTTLVRNASVSSPSATYNASEWTSSAKDTVSNVGSHTMDGIASDLIISEYVEGGGYNKFIEIYNGTGEAIDLVNYAVTLYVNGVAESPNNKTFEFSSLLVI